MFNPTSNKPLAHVRYKRILQVWNNSESAQFITDLGVTRCQPTSGVGQVLLIDRKQPEKVLTRDPEKVLTRDQGNQGP